MNTIRNLLSENKSKTIRYLVIAIVIISAAIVFLFRTGNDEMSLDPVNDPGTADQETMQKDEEKDSETSAKVVVCDVSGAVREPKVVELKKGSRISDAIDAAGGLTEKADITNINRAAAVNDGDKILIPEKGSYNGGLNAADTGDPDDPGSSTAAGSDKNSPQTSSYAASQDASGKININTSDSTALQQITGVGPVTAEKIIDYRNQNGSFSKIEELKDISGIGDKTFEKMKDQVTI